MIQKGIVVFETKIDDRVYQFHLPLGCPANEALNAASEIFKGLEDHVKELVAAQQQKEAGVQEQSQPIEVSAELVE